MWDWETGFFYLLTVKEIENRYLWLFDDSEKSKEILNNTLIKAANAIICKISCTFKSLYAIKNVGNWKCCTFEHENSQGISGEKIQIIFFLLLGHFKRAHVQVAVWSSGMQSFPKNHKEGIKTLSAKKEITQVACLVEVHVHPLAPWQTRRKRANLIILGEVLSLFWG